MTDDENRESEKKTALAHDIAALSKTELSQKYRAAYNSWRNGKSRTKGIGCWAPEFESFTDFLLEVGSPPAAGMTLDRIDNNNPNYGPGLCRWATKVDQANNRSTTIREVNSGEPLSFVARGANEAPDTLRQRIRRSPQATFARSSSPTFFGRDPRQYRPWPHPSDPEVQTFWETRWLERRSRGRISRFDYLVAAINSAVSQTKAELSEIYDPESDEDYSLNEDYQKALSLLEYLQNSLEKTKKARSEWLQAVGVFEGLQNERHTLRGSDYLGRHDKDDNEPWS